MGRSRDANCRSCSARRTNPDSMDEMLNRVLSIGRGKESKFTCIIFIDHQIISHSKQVNIFESQYEGNGRSKWHESEVMAV